MTMPNKAFRKYLLRERRGGERTEESCSWNVGLGQRVSGTAQDPLDRSHTDQIDRLEYCSYSLCICMACTVDGANGPYSR